MSKLYHSKGRVASSNIIIENRIVGGYKVWVLSGVSGFSYDIEVYTGEQHVEQPGESDVGQSSNVVIRLCRSVQSNCSYRVYFDNIFTSSGLLAQLQKRKLQSVGTVRLNRLLALPGP